MTNKGLRKFYYALLLICAVYFIAVAIAHQLGIKAPMLFVFYNIPSERYQDLIISFLSFGWAMLFGIGFLDKGMQTRIHAPIWISGFAAICGLIRARMEIQSHPEIDYEILSLSILLAVMTTAFILYKKGNRGQ